MMIWGRQLKLEPATIRDISDRLPLRHSLGTSNPPPLNFFASRIYLAAGPDGGQMSNSKNWKKSTPPSFRSPYVCQGDLGLTM